MAVLIRKHSQVKGIYFINSKTVVVDQNAYIADKKLNTPEDKAFRHYLKTSKING